MSWVGCEGGREREKGEGGRERGREGGGAGWDGG